MKKLFLFILFFVSLQTAFSQSKGFARYDSFYIEKQGGNGELILSNGSRAIKGFLYNPGNGRTVFKQAVVTINDTTFVIGADTLRIHPSSLGFVDTVYLIYIGDGSPKIPILYAADGNLRSPYAVPGTFTIPFRNADSSFGFNLDTAYAAYKSWVILQFGSAINNLQQVIDNDNHLTHDNVINGKGFALTLDSIKNPTFALAPDGVNASRFTIVDTTKDVWMTIQQSTTSGGSFKQGMQLNVGGIRSGGLSGATNPYFQFIIDSGRVTLLDQFNNYIQLADASFGQPGITFNQSAGEYWMYNLQPENDSTDYKPIAADHLGKIRRMQGWRAFGGTLQQSIDNGHLLNRNDTIDMQTHILRILGGQNSVFSNKLTGTNGDNTEIANFQTVAYMKAAGYDGARYGVVAVDSTNVAFGQTEGSYQFQYHLQENDTSLWKPVAMNSLGFIRRFDGWPAGAAGGGGGGSSYSVTTAPNTANYTVPTGRKVFVYLSDLTGQANRNVVLPAATTGDEFVFVNLNTSASGFVWTFTSGTVKDYAQNTITVLADITTYHLIYGGSNYQISN